MKKWNKPVIIKLDIKSTEAGSGKGNVDGVYYDACGWILPGTSGTGGKPPFPEVP